MDRRQIVLGVVVALAVVVLVAIGFGLGRIGSDSDGGGSDAGARGITATGTGKVKAVPDIATVSLGVSATAPAAPAARRSADAQLARVLAVLKARGVRPADIQTSDITLSPNFGRNGSTIIGYTATNTVDATLRDLTKAGATVAAATVAGANESGGLTLEVSDQNAVYRRALQAAVADARAHAEAIATAAGETLGDLTSATEGSDSSPSPFASEKAVTRASSPIEAGTLEVSADVTATFAVED